MLAEQSRLNLAADDEHRRCRAVVGAAAGVLLHAAAKLAKDQGRDAVEMSVPAEIFSKCRQCAAELIQQRRVSTSLIRMRVKAVQRNVVDPRSQPCVDELGDLL